MNYKKQVDDLIDYAELNEIIKILKVSDQNIFFVGGATRSILSKEYTNTDIDIRYCYTYTYTYVRGAG